VLIATPNLCLDRTLRLPRLAPGAVHRSGQADVTAGGKGVNVARVLRSHGHRPVLVGLVPTVDGEQLRSLLLDEGTELVGVPVRGRTRAATVLVEDAGRVTVVNEPGPEVDAGTWAAYREAVDAALGQHDVLVCTGSLPPGAPADSYGQLTALAREHGAVVVVDAARDALAAALASGPDLVSPNLAEAEAVLAGSHTGPEEVDEDAADIEHRGTVAARALVAAGARRAVVTLGGAGAVMVTPAGVDGHASEHVLVLRAPRVAVASPVGAGDSFVGGVVVGLAREETWPAAVRRGIATATASVEQLLAGGVDAGRAEELLGQVRATPADPAGARA
jgi:1-phosphofructokinase family hexose kinase